jgi:hypothetical protein
MNLPMETKSCLAWHCHCCGKNTVDYQLESEDGGPGSVTAVARIDCQLAVTAVARIDCQL